MATIRMAPDTSSNARLHMPDGSPSIGRREFTIEVNGRTILVAARTPSVASGGYSVNR